MFKQHSTVVPYPSVSPRKATLSIRQRAVATGKIHLVVRGSQLLRDTLKSPLTMSRKGKILESFGQKPNETLEVWLLQAVDKKTAPVLSDEKEWKSTCHPMMDPILLRHPDHKHECLC